MIARLAADAVLAAHGLFILFVVFGAVSAWRWRWAPLAHLPAAAWGVFIEVSGRACPLTALENDLRLRAGGAGYHGSFVEHYLLPVVYPDTLTRDLQFALAGGVLVINAALYGWVLARRQNRV